ncbi:DUF397 domain-containing protein [Glycomyces arizonensis]|uniref:DUF397 domain-containing protein n=1 Tax=Glycomyces arizonensis TaxID=256035 RepID=UPI0012EC93EB|nr:DUF397 domain-containing protein [Glycomyces arizonensis]
MTDQQPTGWGRAKFRKSSRSDSTANGNCVAAAVDGSAVAVGDTKLPTSDGSFQHLVVDRVDWAGLVRAIR